MKDRVSSDLNPSAIYLIRRYDDHIGVEDDGVAQRGQEDIDEMRATSMQEPLRWVYDPAD